MTDASITIGIKADTTGGRTLKRSLDDIAASARKTNEILAQNATQTTRAGAAAVGAASSTRAFGSALSYLKGIALGYIGVRLAQSFFSTTDAITALEGRLRIVSPTMEAVSKQKKILFDIAQKTRQPLAEITNLYTRMTMSLTEQERATMDVAGVTENFSKALAITGESGAQAQSAILQFTQAASSNFQNMGQELVALRDTAPRLVMALENAFKGTGKSLKQLAEDGELSRAKIFAALDSMSIEGQKLSNEFENIPTTVGQAFTKVGNSIMAFMDDTKQAREISEGFAGILSDTADQLPLFGAALNNIGEDSIAAGKSGTAGATMMSEAFLGLATIIDKVREGLLGIRKIWNDIEALRLGAIDAGLSTMEWGVKATGTKITPDMPIAQHRSNVNAAWDSIIATDTGINTSANNYESLYAELKAVQANAAALRATKAQSAASGVVRAASAGAAIGGGGSAESATKAATQALKEQAAVQNELKQVVSSTRTEYEKYADEMARLEALKPFAKTPTEIDAITRAMKAANDNLREYADGFNYAKIAANEFGESAGNTIDTFISDLTRAEVTFSSFRNMALNVLTDVLQAMMKTMNGGQSIGQSIGGMLGKGLMGILGGMGGIGSNPFSAGGAKYGPGFATGGSMVLGGYGGVDKNILSMNGNPIARVSRGETMTVTPQGKGGGGGNIIITNHFSLDAQNVRQQILEAAPQITKAAIAGVQDAQRRAYG
jgi:tape measure domain-containing protein